MAVTWTFAEVNDPKTGRARFNDERGHRAVRGVLAADSGGTYTTGGDDLPVLHFKEVREVRVLALLPTVRTISDGVTINGDATIYAANGAFSEADIGKVVVGTGIPANAHIIAIPAALAARTVDDGVTATDTSLESEDANFVASDVGREVSGTGIPANTRIVSVTDENTVVLSNATTATATDVSVTIAAADEGTMAELSANATATDDDEDVELFVGGTDADTARPHINSDNVIPVCVPGVPGSVKLYVCSTAVELSNATDITGTAFFVEVLGK